MRSSKNQNWNWNTHLRVFAFCCLLTGSLIAGAQEIPFDATLNTNQDTNGAASPDAGGAAPEAEAPAPKSKEPSPYSELDNPNGTTPPAVSAPPPGVQKPAGMPGPSGTTTTGAKGQRRLAPAELSGLGKLAPFNDIAVISKRFLPKTHRFEFFPNIGMVMNDAFFNDYTFGGRLSYYFNENWGIEGVYTNISSSPKSVTSELQTIRFIQTTAYATPTSYMGAAIKWDPIYGKMGYIDKKIVPFDFYFELGGGVTNTSQSTAPPTVHIGVGQFFAIKKWMAAGWNISWFAYNTTTTVTGTTTSGTFNNLHANIGMSFFFPKADYR